MCPLSPPSSKVHRLPTHANPRHLASQHWAHRRRASPPITPLTESDEEASVSFALVGGQCEDAGEVVLLQRPLLFGEVAHDAVPLQVALGEDVEEEGVHIVVQSFVVQEKLGQQAQVLNPAPIRIPVRISQDLRGSFG